MQKVAPIAASGLLLGLIFDWFFYDKIPGVSVFLYAVLILSFTGFFMWQYERPVNKALYWLAPLVLFFSFMVFVRANPMLTFLNICLVVYLLLVVLRHARKPSLDLRDFEIAQYGSLIFSTPIAIMQRSLQFIFGFLSFRSTSKTAWLPIVRGALISLPILFVFLLLLSSADLVFQRYVQALLSFDISPKLVSHGLLIGFVASLFMGAFALIFLPSKTTDVTLEAREKLGLKLGATEATVVLGSVGSLFFLFVIIQLAYLFGGAEHVSVEGHTYAEYARKGFFELIAVAAISLGLILAVKKSVLLRQGSMNSRLKWLSGVLVAEVMIIMLSAHLRLNLYEDAYGFTALRLWSHLFVYWLAIAFWLLLIHIIKESRSSVYAFQLFISVLGFFVFLNFVNPDSFIARQNINRFNETGKIDMIYLSDLSEDAAPEIAKLLDSQNDRVSQAAARILYQQKEYGTVGETEDWQSVNVSRENAKRIFRKHAVQLDAAKNYSGEYPRFDTAE